jgi:hypothetical protein
MYPQYPIPESSPFMGTVHTGRFEGKMLWIHHTHDASLWPSQGVGMQRNVRRERGDRADEFFCLRWTENAEHVPPQMAASPPDRHNTTWLIDYAPVIEQGLVDLTTWVEDGIRPAETSFVYRDGKVTLPPRAAERGGIQPVVHVTADGAARVEVRAGEAVRLEVFAEVPAGAGAIIGVKWDVDGSGAYPFVQTFDGSSREIRVELVHAWERPGTYFVTALVESHREGDPAASARRIPNLAAARVVVV